MTEFMKHYLLNECVFLYLRGIYMIHRCWSFLFKRKTILNVKTRINIYIYTDIDIHNVRTEKTGQIFRK